MQEKITFISLISITALLIIGASYAENTTEFKKVDFDSLFTIKLPKNITLTKTGEKLSNNTTVLASYGNDDEKINIIYSLSNGTKDRLVKTYEEMSKNDSSTNLTQINNTTVIHFSNERDIGEVNYHDLAIAGDDSKYVLIHCDNESLMKSIAASIKFQ